VALTYQEPVRSSTGHDAGTVARHSTYYRPTILTLLKAHESHGYELAGRIAELGFDQRLGTSLYGTLRDMEGDGLITSSWSLSDSGGPPRRIYALTTTGEQVLADSIPLLVRQHRALEAILRLYRDLDDESPTRPSQHRVVAMNSARPGRSSAPRDGSATHR
jgi:DNA-binding PadR family transcriptional regulator